MSRCVESISAKRCSKSFIPIDEAGGFLGRGAGTEEEKGEADNGCNEDGENDGLFIGKSAPDLQIQWVLNLPKLQ
jgi:hypothetical protein